MPCSSVSIVNFKHVNAGWDVSVRCTIRKYIAILKWSGSWFVNMINNFRGLATKNKQRHPKN